MGQVYEPHRERILRDRVLLLGVTFIFSYVALVESCSYHPRTCLEKEDASVVIMRDGSPYRLHQWSCKKWENPTKSG